MPVLLLSRRDVQGLLPMGECIEAMEGAFRALATGAGGQPRRFLVWSPDRAGLLGEMPGFLSPEWTGPVPALGGGPGLGILGTKLVSVFPGNREKGEESHLGMVVLFEGERGRPLAILDGASITAIRTAAVSGLATRLLARPDAGDLALLGSGIQAHTHLEAMRQVRTLSRVRVYSRRQESAAAFAASWRARGLLGLEVEAMPSARAAVEGADLICTVTSSREPVLLGEWISPGAHVNAVGSSSPAYRELDAEAVARSRFFVDLKESTLAESGDFLRAREEGAVGEDHILGELGDLVLGRIEGRRGGDASAEITLCKMLGLAVEDLVAALHVYRKAMESGRGTPWDSEGGAS
jgi:ornithine cyclodeaminase